MKPDRRSLVIPCLLITVGVGWLLTSLGFAPEINWVWTLGLGAIGIFTFILNGFDKVTLVVGPFFLIASLLSVLRQAGQLPMNVEVPGLVIVAGVLILIARSPKIPPPPWLFDKDGNPRRMTPD